MNVSTAVPEGVTTRCRSAGPVVWQRNWRNATSPVNELVALALSVQPPSTRLVPELSWGLGVRVGPAQVTPDPPGDGHLLALAHEAGGTRSSRAASHSIQLIRLV